MSPCNKEFGAAGTRAGLAVTAGGSGDAADLKRAREASTARARGWGGREGQRGLPGGRGGEARLGAGARAGTWDSFVPGVWALGASRHPGLGLCPVAGEEKD